MQTRQTVQSLQGDSNICNFNSCYYRVTIFQTDHRLNHIQLLNSKQIRPSVCGEHARCRVDKNIQDLGYRCICNDGYHIAADNSTTNYIERPDPPQCVDVDECTIENGGCQHYCENSEGSFRYTKNNYNTMHSLTINIFFNMKYKSYFGNQFVGAYVKPDTNNICQIL